MGWKEKILTVVNPVAGFAASAWDKFKNLPTGIKVATGVGLAASVAAPPSAQTYAPSLGTGKSQYPFAQAGLLLIVGAIAALLFVKYGLQRFAVWAMIFAFLGAVIRIWPKQGFFALFGLIAYVSLGSFGLRTDFNVVLTIALTVLLVLFATIPEKIEKLFAWLILIFGGLGIFFLSAWFQQWVGWAWPHIFTTILMLAYVILVFAVGGQKRGWAMLVFNGLFFFLLFSGALMVVCLPDSPCGLAAEGQRMAWANMYRGIVRGGEEVAMIAKQQFYFSTSDYELGVEAKSAMPLGVFLENLGVTPKIVTVDDKVDVFGTVKTASFEGDTLSVKMRCYEDGKETDLGMDPKEVKIAPYESKTVDCKFKGGTIGDGIHTIVLEANFVFPTNAYLKGYFMQQDTIRDYKKQKQSADANPLDMFGITDKNPIAVFTGGPLRIGIGFDQQPVPLVSPSESVGSDRPAPGPSFGVTFDRNWVDGELTSFKTISITLPPGLALWSISGIDKQEISKCEIIDDMQTCTLTEEILKKLFREPILMPQTIRVQTDIVDQKKIMADSLMAVRSVRVNAEYNYRIKKSVSFVVRAAK